MKSDIEIGIKKVASLYSQSEMEEEMLKKSINENVLMNGEIYTQLDSIKKMQEKIKTLQNLISEAMDVEDAFMHDKWKEKVSGDTKWALNQG